MIGIRRLLLSLALTQLALFVATAAAASPAPSPMIDQAHRAAWIFAYKFNAATSPTTGMLTSCLFGGAPKAYKNSQSYVLATKGSTALRDGPGLIGSSTADPVGATFATIYTSRLNFVVWNDQFYRHPNIAGCSNSCGAPWGHSKGVIAWDEQGRGIVMQVTTPSWPGSGTSAAPRTGDGNTPRSSASASMAATRALASRSSDAES